jgi:uncharacterized protein YjbI with pentapeptide repeats
MPSMLHRLFTGEEEVDRPKAAQDTAAEVEMSTAMALGEAASEQAGPARVAQSALPPGLIPASNLPPAADALAQLFAEPAAAEKPQAELAAATEKTSEPAAPELVAEVAPKRRGLFARLFGPKGEPGAAAERMIPLAAKLTEEPVSEMKTVTPETHDAVDPIAAKVDTTTPAESSLPVDVDVAPVAVMAEAAVPIPAEALPSAAAAFDELFPPEEAPVETFAEAGTDLDEEVTEPDPQETEEDEIVEAVAEEDVEALVEVLTSASAEASFETGPQGQVIWSESEREVAEAFNADRRRETRAEETRSEIGRDAARVGVYEARLSHEAHTVASAKTTGHEATSIGRAEISQVTPADKPAEQPAVEGELAASGVTPVVARRPYKEWEFDEKLASHREWVESHGAAGQRADLAGVELEASDLISVNLRLADLHDANLRASDLLLADLRDACLVRADLEEACLVGANLEGANLEGASLETAMGLVPRQFSGANLRDALLAPHLMEFEAVGAFERASRNAFRYFVAMTSVSVLSWLVIAKTRDVQLLTDSAIIPFLHSHAAAAAVPTAESYLIAPVAIFILYLLFHFHLQRLWDAVIELPAIFPDGHTLGDRGPGIITGLLRTHFRWMNPDPSSTRLVEKGVSLLVAYWIVPATLLLFWARYLTRQEIHGTVLQALLVVVATGVAAYATTKVGRPQERWAFEKKWAQRFVQTMKAVSPFTVASVAGVILLLISAGIIAGVPHEHSRAPQYGATNIRRWASTALWWLAYDPYADLTEASISRRPAGWSGADEQVASVDGLRMNNARFRYAQAYGAFFANSHLWRADFQGAFLSEADLRGADLGQSNLRFAVMDHAQMNHANLDHSNLDGADMRRADLRGANLSYGTFTDAILVDARLDGASFYTARLQGATLTRANLEKADLRESFLGGTHMDHADLQSAYLWSAKLPGADLGGAQLGSAILIDADLHGANLGGAQLAGTVLNGADLSGTSLEGADLRGTLGLNANQVCSAKSRRGVQLDADMATQVEALCGKQ